MLRLPSTPLFVRRVLGRPVRVLAGAAFVVLGAGAPALRAQELRSLESSRQLHDSAATTVRVRYGAGRLSVRPSDEPQLYRMALRYDATQVEPIHSFDAAARRLDIGVRADRVRWPHGARDGSMDLELARGVPLDLTLELGATEADVDLGGLSLDALRIESGATDGRVRFDAPNPRPMRRLEVQAGAASFRASRLANANARAVSVDAGVGDVDLDFGGVWTHDVDLDLTVALGGTTVRVPRDVGVRVELDRAFAGFAHPGLERRGGAWVSENWDDAAYRLRVRGSAASGKLTIERR